MDLAREKELVMPLECRMVLAMRAEWCLKCKGA